MATPINLIKEALILHRGLVTPAAKALGMTYQGLNKRIKSNKVLQEIRDSEREGNIDRNIGVLNKITNAALNPKANESEMKLGADVAKYLLDRIGKHRGYVVRTEVKDITPQKKQIIKIGTQIIEL